MDAAYLFAENLVEIKYQDLPREVVEITKKQVLDILGVALGGSSKSGIGELAELIGEWGGKPESTIFVSRKSACSHAPRSILRWRMLLTTMIPEKVTHPSAVIVPTCLAVSEHKEK
jgi:2-methylcitrate dehydratase PrpD